ncbi:hypothetical protein SCOCK_30016 [Actinacidiphila cocklensis]|uniref:Uncharacterized protein n=1 Tax=Actinacidiphila cocklensis TaxID=887465 RepID=A0A9W4DRA1_9ACTN|nr:hypothetical protein SCOCK_30016 [Actinacidiphila cocklensis]
MCARPTLCAPHLRVAAHPEGDLAADRPRGRRGSAAGWPENVRPRRLRAGKRPPVRGFRRARFPNGSMAGIQHSDFPRQVDSRIAGQRRHIPIAITGVITPCPFATIFGHSGQEMPAGPVSA